MSSLETHSGKLGISFKAAPSSMTPHGTELPFIVIRRDGRSRRRSRIVGTRLANDKQAAALLVRPTFTDNEPVFAGQVYLGVGVLVPADLIAPIYIGNGVPFVSEIGTVEVPATAAKPEGAHWRIGDRRVRPRRPA